MKYIFQFLGLGLFTCVGSLTIYGATSPATPLEQVLTPEGKIKAPAGFSGSLNPTGYQMVLDATGAPRFVSSKTAVIATRIIG